MFGHGIFSRVSGIDFDSLKLIPFSQSISYVLTVFSGRSQTGRNWFEITLFSQTITCMVTVFSGVDSDSLEIIPFSQTISYIVRVFSGAPQTGFGSFEITPPT